MKTIQILVITTFLVAAIGCSKQEATEPMTETSAAEMPAMDKATETGPVAESSADTVKSAEMLPNEIDAADVSGTNVEQDNSGKKVLYWQDPMMTDRHFSKSGQSPFMDMKLEPKYAE
jgi:Heavy metal binding domain